jgi:serine/threonine protein kinase
MCYQIDMELFDCSLADYIRGCAVNEPVVPSPVIGTSSLPGQFIGLHDASGLVLKWDLMEQVVAGLKFLHNNNLVHQAVKSSNSMPPIPKNLLNK